MKTARRQELRTNELSQQIEDISTYVKENFVKLTAVVVTAAAIVGGSYYYVANQRAQVMAHWEALEQNPDPSQTANARIESFKGIAQGAEGAGLSAAAWLKIGNTAVDEVLATPDGAVAHADLLQKAEDAYQTVIKTYPDNMTAVGNSMMGLALVHQLNTTPDYLQAREIYLKIKDDKRFTYTPYPSEAEYRLAHLDQWAQTVRFPAPPPPPITQQIVGPLPPAQPTAGQPAATQAAAATDQSSGAPADNVTVTSPGVNIRQLSEEEAATMLEENKAINEAAQAVEEELESEADDAGASEVEESDATDSEAASSDGE